MRDQISLPAEEATSEEVLVNQRQLATSYRYFLYFGVGYSFGSIFSPIVNPRFGGKRGYGIRSPLQLTELRDDVFGRRLRVHRAIDVGNPPFLSM